MVRLAMFHHSIKILPRTFLPLHRTAVGFRQQFTRSFANAHTNEPGYSIAIVGSGPSGCYTAKYLLSSSSITKIDILDRLPTPYGLVRYGVAPDHPEVKNVQHDFDASVFSHAKVRFWGHAKVGGNKNVSVQELRERYDAVVLAYGCETDRKLGLPGETELTGILSAREFVAWYNGRPDYEHIGAIVDKAFHKHPETASVVVIGQGNVALDCARVLTKASPGLYATDVASRALDILGSQGVNRVSVVGRRGHVQGAFTIKELRELVKLKEQGHGTDFVVRPEELELGSTEASLEEIKKSRPKTRIDKLLRDASAVNIPEDTSPPPAKRVELRFLMNPCRFEPSPDDPTSLGAVVCERTRLEGKPNEQKAVGTGEFETLPASLALVSIGYKGVALENTEQWFHEKAGVYKHTGGKVDNDRDVGGLYVAGWLKRGPTGIIGSNIADARETVKTIVDDLEERKAPTKKNPEDLASLLTTRGVQYVNWEGYKRLEEYEFNQRRHEDQPREKVTSIDEMLKAARG